MIFVVGSGPAAVSALVALTRAGHAVTVLDYGNRMEASTQERVARMGGQPPGTWSETDLKAIKSGMKAGRSGVPLKSVHGSNYPYLHAADKLGFSSENAGLTPSLGLGGFSSVWGASLLPVLQSDIEDWPLRLSDLETAYAAVAGFMPVAARNDSLSRTLPLYGPFHEPFPSAQAERLLSDLERKPLENAICGRSRVAVSDKCNGCGVCLYGCPYGAIYNSADTLHELVSKGTVNYQSGVLVTHFEENDREVRIHAQTAAGPVSFKGDALFLAAGVLASTQLVTRSLGLRDCVVPISDSQYYLIPIFRAHREKGVSSRLNNTLSNAFIEFQDEALSPYSVHLQAYGYNDLYEGVLARMLPGLHALLPMRQLTERLLLIQGYLHSHHCPKLKLAIRPDGMHLSGESSKQVRALVGAVRRRLKPLGLVGPAKVELPGRGYHSGCTLPMREHPVALESDLLGRPRGFSRVHVVDSSVLPSIPPTTITYTVMANAYRIARDFTTPGGNLRGAPRGRRGTCLVTGANGFVGSVLCAQLRAKGYEVIEAVRRPFASQRHYRLQEPIDPRLFEGVDCVVHAAYDFSEVKEASVRAINQEGSLRFLKAAKAAGIERLVLVSSLSAFEGCKSIYGQVKLALEKEALVLGYQVIRPGLVHDRSPGGMVAALKKAASLPVVLTTGMGLQQQYLVHGEDLGAAVAVLLEVPPTGEVLCAAHPRPETMRSILQSLAGRRRLFFIPLPPLFIYIGLKLLEILDLRMRLRSDSLVALLNPAPSFDASLHQRLGLKFRRPLE